MHQNTKASYAVMKLCFKIEIFEWRELILTISMNSEFQDILNFFSLKTSFGFWKFSAKKSSRYRNYPRAKEQSQVKPNPYPFTEVLKGSQWHPISLNKMNSGFSLLWATLNQALCWQFVLHYGDWEFKY